MFWVCEESKVWGEKKIRKVKVNGLNSLTKVRLIPLLDNVFHDHMQHFFFYFYFYSTVS